jgi:hypothetical protein
MHAALIGSKRSMYKYNRFPLFYFINHHWPDLEEKVQSRKGIDATPFYKVSFPTPIPSQAISLRRNHVSLFALDLIDN